MAKVITDNSFHRLVASQDPAKVVPPLIRQAFAAHATALPTLFDGQAESTAADLRAVTDPIAANVNKLVDAVGALKAKVGTGNVPSPPPPPPAPTNYRLQPRANTTAYLNSPYSDSEAEINILRDKQRQAKKQKNEHDAMKDAIDKQVKRRLQDAAQAEEDEREVNALRLRHALQRIRYLEGAGGK